MIEIEAKCWCCGQVSRQPLAAAGLASDGAAGATTLDGFDPCGRKRGIAACPTCGVCAPDLSCPVPGLSRAAVRAGCASAAWRDALGSRSIGVDAAHPHAMRWFAYATVFACHLPPAAAGRAWSLAAAELEATLRSADLHRPAPAPRGDLAALARHRAAQCLQRVFRADFPAGGLLPPALARGFGRVLAGEPMRDALRLEVDHDGELRWRRDLGRFDRACLLADSLRRLGEFDAALTVAERVLPGAPDRHAALLRRQARLASAQDEAAHLLHPPAAPVPVPAEPIPALVAA